MSLTVFLGFLLASCCFPLVRSTCPSQCSCFYHNLSDGSRARSVICNDPEISLVPATFPGDTSKLRIEKTAIKRIPSEAFSYLSNLEFLWMSFNVLSSVNSDSFRGLYSLEELRLDGNSLTSFPWESLMDMPSLRLLDIHNNQLSSVPSEAAPYMKNLTYLDLSSNNLLTVPSEVLNTWLTLKPIQGAESSKMILGLHDNPWLCDCRLYDLVQFQKSPSLSVAFIDIRLRCGPRVHTAVLAWRRADGKPLNGTAQLENSKEGIVWSILSVPAVSYRDTGKYICKATNYAGSAEAVISLIISDASKAENPTVDPKTKVKSKKPNSIVKAAYQEKHIATYVSPTPNNALPIGATVSYRGPYPGMESDNAANSRTNTQTASPDGFLETNLSNLAANTSSLQQDPDRVVRSVKVIGDTDYTVCLNWRAPTAKNTTAFSVLYAVFGERDMRRINVSPGNNRIVIEGLVPKTKYIACVCVKGLIPKKEQCVIFSTDAAASANGTQKLINVVVITVACVIAVPLTVIVCCGALKRKIKKFLGKKSKDIQDSYVTFETLSPSTKAKGLEGEYLNRLNTEESNRLLSARSSLDSESTAKIEGQPNEYFC
uniref:Leucine-rich repeat, immunoglobulin-like domain and transmembrane domain-containing protein 1 n=1 Tax=Cyprinus carpio carpio TaxID=630221 RepID=A0A9J8BV20_CYPCA